jgi:hypothetical protein
MALGREDATRIVRFCLAGEGWGSAIREEDVCTIKLVLTGGDQAETHRFDGPTFEAAFREACSAGVLKRSCVDKQIAFLSRTMSPGPAVAFNDVGGASGAPLPGGLFAAIAALVSTIVHETQRERGISSLYAASGGRLFGRELTNQWRATDRRRRELTVFREPRKGAAGVPARVANRLGDAGQLLDAVIATRDRVEGLRTIPVEIIETYSRMNGELLRIVDDVAAMVAEPEHRPSVLAWTALLYAKEKTGIERAQLASAFERDRYFDGQYQAVLGLIAARQSYLHLFAIAAPPPFGKVTRERLVAEAAEDVERMERIALLRREGGFGVDPLAWFAAITRQMDLLSEAEAKVRASLSG